MNLVAGKVALITGASRGIGRAIALRFAQEGANVAFTYLSSVEKGQALEAELAALVSKPKGTAPMRLISKPPTTSLRRSWPILVPSTC